MSSSKSSPSSNQHASSMAELMAHQSSAFQGLKKGDFVKGTVKKLTSQEILLDIGAKSDALVIEYDKKNLENLLQVLQVGDSVQASVISPESEEGFPVVSLRRALDDLMFSRFEKLISDNASVNVTIQDTTKGGFFVESDNGIHGFLPNSQVLTQDLMAGDTLFVKVIEFDKAKKRVIFSEKAIEYLSTVSEIAKYLKEGQEVNAMVESVASYGVFVTIEPKKDVLIEGFIHISEISYQRVENLGELVHKGDKIKAVVTSIDTENRRVNLSIKKLEKDTFSDVQEKYPVEKKLKAVIISVKSRGVTLRLEDGIEGFIAAAKIPTGVSYKENDTIEVEVSDYDQKRRLVIVSPVLTAKFVGYR